MNQTNAPPFGTLAIAFLAGAAVGAVVMALTTPKTGPQVRDDLKDLGIRIRSKAAGLLPKDREEAQTPV